MKLGVFVFAVALSSLLVLSFAQEGGKKVLVLFDDFEVKSTHSIFFKNLEAKYSVEYARADNRTVDIKKYGEWNYDNIVLFSRSSDIHAISSKLAIEFIDDGRNILIATDSAIPKAIREIATECNSEFDDAGTNVIDHFHFDSSDVSHHTTLVVPFPEGLSPIFGRVQNKAPILYSGVGQDILEDSSVIFSILSGSETSYSGSVSKVVGDKAYVAGKRTTLVSALQARNNARATFSGSLDLFSDKFILSAVEEHTQGGKSKKFDKSGNEEFTSSLVDWTFQERGFLRVKSVSHHRVGEPEASSVYTVKEEVQYTIEIEEYKAKKWVPFVADDVQVEFIMLDPYVRSTLKGENGKFSTTFTLPDVYGYFTFKVEYIRKGYSRLDSIVRVPVRPYRHNQFERFIDAAYPYYASSLSMIVGLFLFSLVFLYHREKKN